MHVNGNVATGAYISLSLASPYSLYFPKHSNFLVVSNRQKYKSITKTDFIEWGGRCQTLSHIIKYS